MLGDQLAPDLLPKWDEKVARACPFELSSQDLQLVHRIAEQYCWDRASLLDGTTYDEIRSSLERIAHACRLLLSAVDEGPMAETWRRIERVNLGARNPPWFSRDRTYRVLTSLSARAHKAIIELDAQKQARPRLDTSDLWRFFVTELADLFDRHGQPATASKPSDKSRHTKFTRFAWAVMETVPDRYREHNATRDAMADAISEVLAQRKGLAKSVSEKGPSRTRIYPTDLTDAQWAVIAPLIPEAEPGGRPRRATSRELVNAILYHLETGTAWRLLPRDLPPWSTVYLYFRRWQREGVWDRIHQTLMTSERASRER